MSAGSAISHPAPQVDGRWKFTSEPLTLVDPGNHSFVRKQDRCLFADRVPLNVNLSPIWVNALRDKWDMVRQMPDREGQNSTWEISAKLSKSVQRGLLPVFDNVVHSETMGSCLQTSKSTVSTTAVNQSAKIWHLISTL
jgi:hypothetical protein